MYGCGDFEDMNVISIHKDCIMQFVITSQTLNVLIVYMYTSAQELKKHNLYN